MRYRLTLLLWLLTDIALFIAMYVLSYFIRIGWIFSSVFPFHRFVVVAALTAPIWLLMLSLTGTFRLTSNQKTLKSATFLFYANIVGVSIFSLMYYFIFGVFFSRLLLVYALGLSTVAIWVWHIVYERISRQILRSDPPSFPTLIVGITRESKALIETLNKKKSPLKPVAVLDGKGTKEASISGVPVLGKLNKLDDVLESQKITHLIQCSDLEQTLNLLSACRSKKLTYMLLPSVLGIVEGDEQVEILEGSPVTVVKPKAL